MLYLRNFPSFLSRHMIIILPVVNARHLPACFHIYHFHVGKSLPAPHTLLCAGSPPSLPALDDGAARVGGLFIYVYMCSS